MSRPPEPWLRGPLPGIAQILQPVAYGLIYCREAVQAALAGLSPEQLRSRPGEIASVGFHVRHAIGSLDRLLTYARDEPLSDAQTASLAAEKLPDAEPADAAALVDAFNRAVDRALAQLKSTDEATLLNLRAVGRARLPSTVLGLLFHADEHTQRHTGQIITTAKLVRTEGIA